MTSLKRVVSEILFSRGFESYEEGDHLFGRRGDTDVVFCLLPNYHEEKARRFLEDFEDFQGSRIIATLDSISELRRTISEPRIFIWDREAIEHEIGRARIERILGEEGHGLLDEFAADDYPPIVSQEELEMMDVADVGEMIVRPMIDIDDVKEISSQTVGGFRHRLELVPHYVFEYRCSLRMSEEERVSKVGLLAVNALTRKVEPWKDDFETVFAIELNHRRMEPMIEIEDARNAVREEVIQLHTYERELIRDDGRATVTERKLLSPSPDDVGLVSQGIIYLPVWCVEGVHGVMIINAGTGKIISEDYYRS